jgi:glutamate carboxypeptidase
MSNTQTQPVRELLTWIEARRDKMLQTLARLVQLESPSNGRQALNRLGDYIGDQFEELGGRPTIHRQREYGDVLQFDFGDTGAAKPIMLLGHYDTVWELNTTATMPFRLSEGRAFGPGVFDMKGGIA